jgi:hypothetical protein
LVAGTGAVVATAPAKVLRSWQLCGPESKWYSVGVRSGLISHIYFTFAD